jgi:hypothetical protein
MVVSATNDVVENESSTIALEDHARTLMHRIELAIMGCDREGLTPVMTPGHSSELEYQISLGIEAGVVVWDDPEEISLGGAAGQQVFWRQNPDEPDERSVAWSNLARPFLEGELPNGVDDNGNGLVDEQGLTFVVDRNSITIRLTVGRMNDGELVTTTVESLVTVRNNPVD